MGIRLHELLPFLQEQWSVPVQIYVFPCQSNLRQLEKKKKHCILGRHISKETSWSPAKRIMIRTYSLVSPDLSPNLALGNSWCTSWYMNIYCSSPSELKVMNQDVQPYLTLIRCFETPADSLNYSTPTNEPDSNFPCFGLLLTHCRLFMWNSLHAITWAIILQGNQLSWNSGTPNFQQTKVFMTDPRTGEGRSGNWKQSNN